MKRFIVICVVIFASLTAKAQSVVSGKAIDASTGMPEVAAVMQFVLEDKVVAYTTTGEDGLFSQALAQKGEYTLVFENVGRKKVEIKFESDGKSEINLGEILIEDDVETLQAGQVVAQRTLVKMDVDKTTYDVENDTDSKTSTVLDMLRKVPMVSVDGQDNITVNGSSSFLVYVDGKPNQMIQQNASTVFKMMPASAVKSIEVTTNPGAKHDAEGVGGVLNIITNKEVTGGQSVSDGYYGNASAMASNKGVGVGVYSSMQKGKFSMGLNVNANTFNEKNTTIDVDRVQDQGVETGNHMLTETRYKGLMGNFTATYEIDTLNVISGTAGIMSFSNINDGLSSASITYPGVAPIEYSGTVLTDMKVNNITAGADYQHTWADHKDRNIVFSYQFSAAPGRTFTNNTFDNLSIDGTTIDETKMNKKENSVSNIFQTDFTTGIGENQTLSSGLKFTSRHNYSDVDNLASGMSYDFYNKIGALYTEFSGNYGKLGLKAGARYEHTWQNYNTDGGNDFSTNYGNLVPSASLQWNLGQMQNVGLSYNMRISRPGISYLNPYVDDTDPTALTYGNPEVESEIGHTINLVYNFYSPVLITNLTFRNNWCGNGISQYSYYDNNNILNTTYGNIVRTFDTGVNGFVMVIPGQKTRIYLNGGASYATFVSDQLSQANSGWQHNILLGLQQTLPWDLRASANIIERGRTLNLQGWSDGMSLAVMSLTKTFLDDRLSFSLSAVSPFTKDGCFHINNHSEGSDFVTDTNISIPVRQLHFQMSWTFGKQGNYNAKKIQRGISEDKQLEASKDNQASGNMGSSMMGGM